MPFLIPLIGLLSGILTGITFSPSLYLAGGLIIISLGLYFLILKKSSDPVKALEFNKFHQVWIFCLFAACGLLDVALQKPNHPYPDLMGNELTYKGNVKEFNSLSTGERLWLEITEAGSQSEDLRELKSFNALLYTDGLSIEKGDIIIFHTSLKELKNSSFPEEIVESYSRKGLFCYGNTSSSEIKITGHVNNFLYFSEKIRTHIEIVIEKSSLSNDTQDFIISLLLGDKSFLNEQTKELFNETGIAHVLALSGLHVAIILGIFLFFLYPVQFLGHRKLRYFLSVILMWGFTLLTGASFSTIRAAIMATLVMIAFVSQRKNNALNSLLCAAFIIFLIDPFSIYDIGLQLSLLSVGAIISFPQNLNPVERHPHPILYNLISAILVSFIATFATWALISFYFKKVSLLFLPANLLLVPTIPLFIFISFIYVAFLLMGIDLHFISVFLDEFYFYFLKIVDYLSLGHSTTLNFQLSGTSALLWTLGVILLIAFVHVKKSKSGRIILSGVSAGLLGLSVLLIFIFPATNKDSMVFGKRYSEISMTINTDNEHKKYVLPPNTIGRLSAKDTHIFSIDNKISNSDSLFLCSQQDGLHKYLIIGRGFGKSKLVDIPSISEFEKIIIHPSVYKKTEELYFEEALELGFTNLHSLRNDGPLEIEI